MSYGTAGALQAAVYQALLADTGLQSLIGRRFMTRRPRAACPAPM